MCHDLDGLEVCTLGIQPCQRTIIFCKLLRHLAILAAVQRRSERIVADLATAHLAGDSPQLCRSGGVRPRPGHAPRSPAAAGVADVAPL